MTLRLIGGAFRGRLIKAPKNDLTRPTSGILRKSVFDICKNVIQDAQFLDLFAGSGAMGIEAISRGAKHATFIDNDKKAILCIHENLKNLRIENQADVLFGDALKILNRLEKYNKTFDIIYIDPPYGLNADKDPLSLNAHLLQLLDQSQLAQNAIVFIEEAFPSQILKEKIPLKRLALKDSRRFGKSVLHQYHSQ